VIARVFFEVIEKAVPVLIEKSPRHRKLIREFLQQLPENDGSGNSAANKIQKAIALTRGGSAAA
jgi:hypothetical protein